MLAAVIVALIGWFGSSVVAEVLRRRDSRAKLTADVELWSKLPRSAVKDQLIKDIEKRLADYLAIRQYRRTLLLANAIDDMIPKNPVKAVFGSLLALGVALVVTNIPRLVPHDGNGLERHADGRLWIRSALIRGGSVVYEYITLHDALVNACKALFAFSLAIGFSVWARNRWKARRSRTKADESTTNSPKSASAD
jgi:hypothetical protein